MNLHPYFLELARVLRIHQQMIKIYGGEAGKGDIAAFFRDHGQSS